MIKTITRFHSTSDTRKALENFDGVEINGLKLDVQVPERFRCDLDQHRIEIRKSSMSGGPFGPNNNSLSSRHSFVRKNSIRNTRAMSNNQGDLKAHRNSIFSPQDARSDLPGLPEVPQVQGVEVPQAQGVQASKNSRQSSLKQQGQKTEKTGRSHTISVGNEGASVALARSESK
jgi:hypothetical protein